MSCLCLNPIITNAQNTKDLSSSIFVQPHICGGHGIEQTQNPFIPPKIGKSHKNSSVLPNPPTNIQVHFESPYHMYITWDPAVGCTDCTYALLLDNNTNPHDGNYYYSAITSGNNYIRLTRNYTTLAIDELFNVYLQTYDNTTSTTSNWEDGNAGTYSYGWDMLGHPDNEITFEYNGWSSTQIDILTTFTDRMKPIIRDVFGHPSHSHKVVIKNRNVGAFYAEQSDTIYIAASEIFTNRRFHLLTHEIIHAWKDNAILAINENWGYDSLLSAYEEGTAQIVAHDCINQYINQYGNDYDLSGVPTILNKTYLSSPYTSWDYDFRHQTALTSGAFYTDSGDAATDRGLTTERYEMAASALKKIQVEYPNFYKDFNQEYYRRLSENNFLTVSKNLIIDIIASVAPTIEGKNAIEWINQQEILGCQIIPGQKIYNSSSYTTSGSTNRYYFYETFSDGNNYQGSTFNHLNGTVGTGRIYNSSGQMIKNFSPKISEPSNNYGNFVLALVNYDVDISTANRLDWGVATPLALYKVEMTFGSVTEINYRVVGDNLSDGNSVFGGIINANGGQIYIDHEDFPEEDPLQIVNGAFYGTRNWVNIPNSDTGGADSTPGQLTIRYIDDAGNEYIAYKNIEIGNGYGLQALLFDVNDMIPTMYCSPDVPTNSNNIHISNVRLEQINNTSGNEGYADFTQNTNSGETAANLLPSGTHTLIVQRPSTPGVSTYWKVWIDYNQNNVFEDTESIMYKTNQANNSITHNFVVPEDAMEGTTRMRVHLKEWVAGAPVPCGNNDNVDAEIEDYTIIIGNVTTCPDGTIPTTPGTSCNDGNPNTTNDVIQPDGCTCQGTAIGSSDYCIPNTVSASNYIWSVVLAGGGISNTSGNEGGYKDFTTEVAPGNISPLETYTLNLYKASDNGENMYWRVWIDYNQDGIFDNNTELVVNEGAISDNVLSRTFTVPGGIPNGTTRMRVYLKEYFGVAPISCGNDPTVAADVEDYAITIGEDDCQPFYDLSGTINTNVFKAQDYIESDGQVPAGNNVTFQAGNLVHLKPGFIATAGTTSKFHALIDDCTATSPKEEIADSEPAIRNYPNPFTGQTTIEFTLPEDSAVTLFVSDAMGKQVAVLMNHETSIAGTHQVIFDGNR